MKKILGLFVLFAIFVGCSSSSRYQLKENWIDQSDVQFALAHPALSEWFPQMGDPVITELHGDTVYFIYNYHPPLFATVKNGVEYKPTNNDRVNGVWGKRNELLALQILNNRLVGIRNMTDYGAVVDTRTAEKKESSPVWVWVLVGTVAVVSLIFSIAD